MIMGVDVSVWQDANNTPQKIDFAKMKAAGANFAYIRCAFGTSIDEDFYDNWKAAKTAGILRGAYCFWDYRPGAASPATQIARWMALLAADSGELPPAIDVERANADWPALPAHSVVLDAIWQFDNAVKTILKRDKSVLYTNPAAIHAVMKPVPEWLAAIPLWCAHWYANAPDFEPWQRWTFWQYALGKGRGPEFGVESLDIDLDYFNGTLEELKTFAGVTLPAPEPDEPPEETPVGIYDSYGKGVVLTHAAATPPAAALKGADYLIIEAGWGADYYPEAADRIGLAADLKVPAILHYKMDCGPYFDMGFDPAKWPKPELDPHMKTLDRAVFMGGQVGGVKRTIHAIWLDLTYNVDANGVVFTENWMAGLAEHLTNLSWARHKIPVYWLCSQTVLNAYGNKANGALATLFTGQPMSCKKMAFSAQPATVNVATVEGVQYPPDDQKPDYLYGNPFLWWYTNTKFVVGGIQMPAVMFWGKKEKLYAELGFSANEPPPPPPPPPPDDDDDPPPDTNPVDNAALVAAIDRLTAQAKRIADWLEKINK